MVRDQTDDAGDVRFLVVKCGPYQLGLPADCVRAVVAASEMVPLGLPDLRGLVWRDGALLPVTGLAPLLGLSESADEMGGHGVMISTPEGPVCLVVDEALDLVELPAGSVRPLPPLVLRAVDLVGLDSAATVGGILLVVDPVRLLGPGRAADLVGAAARIGGSGGNTAGRE